MKKFVLVVYLLLNVLMCVAGIREARRLRLFSGCYDRLARIEYVLPGFQMGCYLGVPPGMDLDRYTK